MEKNSVYHYGEGIKHGWLSAYEIPLIEAYVPEETEVEKLEKLYQDDKEFKKLIHDLFKRAKLTQKKMFIQESNEPSIQQTHEDWRHHQQSLTTYYAKCVAIYKVMKEFNLKTAICFVNNRTPARMRNMAIFMRYALVSNTEYPLDICSIFTGQDEDTRNEILKSFKIPKCLLLFGIMLF